VHNLVSQHLAIFVVFFFLLRDIFLIMSLMLRLIHLGVSKNRKEEAEKEECTRKEVEAMLILLALVYEEGWKR